MTEDFKLRINNVWVVVSSEPIEALGRTGRFHALVSSDNASLSMEGGVAKAIRVASGEAILDEAQKLVPLRLGDVAVTSAGQLPARYVLHAVTVDRFLAVRPSELTIRVAAENVFRRCELLAVRRLAMPALGTGAAQFAADHCAKVIVGALLKHTASPTVMEEVVFSLPHQDARSAFHNFLQRAHLHDGGNLDTAAAAEADVSTKAAGLSPDTTQSRESHNRVAAVATASRPLVSNRYVLLEEIGRGGTPRKHWPLGLTFLAVRVAHRCCRYRKQSSSRCRRASKQRDTCQGRFPHRTVS